MNNILVKKFFLSNLIVLSIITSTFFNLPLEASASEFYIPKSETNEKVIIEHLKIKVESDLVDAWLKTEKESWEPWLKSKKGFQGRNLFWDPINEEAILLISWENRDLWKSITDDEVNKIQKKFERIARKETGLKNGNPFPLVFEGELLPK
tara:strand:- start:35 stop:487 length:453 start_codon:yes stop_codon:yes gene_type:complete